MFDEEDDDTFQSCKVVLVGESGVGKTCINNRFIKGSYNSNVVPTASALYSEKIMTFSNGEKIKFDIWDTAGQEKFRSLGKIFYNESKAVILVYDITNGKSFAEIKNYWHKQILTYCPKNVDKYLY